ncbi:MAG: hypothetical protein QXP52_01125 [Candidatus Aenigmatarchaeota archaeon]
MSLSNFLFGFLLPFFLFFLLVYALLRRTQIFKEYTIEFGISFIIALLGSYWLYVNNLSDILLASSGLVIIIIFLALIIFSIAFSGYKRIKETYKEEVKKEK